MSVSPNQKQGAIHLSDITDKHKWEPQRTNHFEIQIAGLAKSEDLVLAVNTFSLPNITNDAIEIGRQNSKIKYAGQAVFAGADSMEVIDYIGADIEGIVYDWRLSVYNPDTDRVGLAAEYKKDAIVIEYSPDYEKLRSWKIKGLWPSAVSFGDSLSMDGSEVKKVMLTLTYDRAYREDKHTT